MKVLQRKTIQITNSKILYPLAIVLLFMSIAGSILFSWVQHKKEIKNIIEYEINHDISFVLTACNERLNLIIAQLLTEISLQTPTSQEEFIELTDHLLNSFPFVQSIDYISQEQTITYVSPLSGNEKVLGLAIELPALKNALREAHSSLQPVLSQPFQIGKGGLGYSLMVPGNNNDFFEIVFTTKSFFSQEIFEHIHALSLMEIFDGSTSVFRSESWEQQSYFVTEHKQFLDGNIFQRPIQIAILPAPEIEGEHRAIWKYLVTGSIATLILSILVILGQSQQITERKRNEEMLEEEGRLKQSLVDGLPFPAFLLNPKDRIVVMANRAAMNIGVTIGETCYKDWLNQEVPCPECPLEKSGVAGLSSRFEKNINNKIWDVRLFSISEDLCMHLYVDITESKQMLEKIKISENRYRSLVEEIPAKVCHYKKDGTIIFANKPFCSFYNEPLEKLIGSNYFDLSFDEKEREKKVRSVHSMGPDNLLLSYEHKGISPKGDVVWERCTEQALLDPANNRDIQEIQSFRFDITNQKTTEEILRRTTDELTLLLSSLPIIPYSVIIKDTLTFRYIYGKIEEITGFSQGDFISDDKFFVNQILPEDRDRVIRDFYTTSDRDETRHHFRFRTKDEKIIWLSNIFRNTLDTGEENSCTGVLLDITAEMTIRKESESRLQQVIQADKLAALGEVVAGVAHEINNPVSFITYNTPIMRQIWDLFLPALKEYDSDHPDWEKGGFSFAELAQNMEEIIGAIETGTTRITSVVTNLKDFSQVSHPEKTQKFSLNDVVEKTLTIVGAQTRKAFATIDVDLDDAIPDIIGNLLNIEQVIANLLLNATHAVSDKKTAKLSIRTLYIASLEVVVVEVEDNGSGIQPENLSKIMDPFFTTKRDQNGTGLGLSVSYGLVKEHNGAISVISKPDKGSRFTVFLPLNPGRSKHVEIRPTLLVVDDNKPFLELLENYFLKIDDTDIHTINTPEDVLHHIDNHPEIDFIISDIDMPKMNGWELFEKIKEKFPLLSVILYSGNPDMLSRKPAGLDPEACLEKPITGKGIAQHVNKIGRMQVWGSS